MAVSLPQEMCAMMLSGLRVPELDADVIAAQASEENVRAGAFAPVFPAPPAANAI